MSADASTLLEHLFRRQSGRMVAHLARRFDPAHLEIAEEAVQGAMLRALQTWPYHGVPENPEAWLFRVAQNSAIDALRRGRWVTESIDAISAERAPADSRQPGDPDFEEQLRDDELRMIFMCSHPDLPRDASIALSLKIAGGLSAREIARAFLAEETAIEQRIVRAKRQLRESGLTLSMPRGDELDARLDSVFEVIYFIFNEGYTAHSGDALIRHDLCEEALRLGLLIARSNIDDPRADALVALMAFQAARAPARIDESGELILLEDQDRSRWNHELIALGFRYFERSLRGDRNSEYHAQAAIAATHARARDLASADWPLILEAYDHLYAMNPSPVVALNRAVAIAKVHGAAQALEAIKPLEKDRTLRNYYLLLAVRGHLLLELARGAEAAECFRAALELPCSEPERRLLRRKLAQAER